MASLDVISKSLPHQGKSSRPHFDHFVSIAFSNLVVLVLMCTRTAAAGRVRSTCTSADDIARLEIGTYENIA